MESLQNIFEDKYGISDLHIDVHNGQTYYSFNMKSIYEEHLLGIPINRKEIKHLVKRPNIGLFWRYRGKEYCAKIPAKDVYNIVDIRRQSEGFFRTNSIELQDLELDNDKLIEAIDMVVSQCIKGSR